MRASVFFLVVFWLCMPSGAAAFDLFSRALDRVEKGNKLYQDQHYEKALEEYERAEQEVEQEPRIHFNRGSALFKLGRAKEARETFMRAMGIEEPELKKQNYYNIGNTFLAEGAFRDAISYYRRALEMDPSFDDARFNLEIALRAIQQQQQQQKSGDSGQKKDDQGDQEKKQDEGDKNQDQEGDQKQDQDKSEGDKKDSDQEDKQQDQQKDQGQKEEDQKQDPNQDEGSKDQKKDPQEKGQEQEKQQDQKDQQQDQKQSDQAKQEQEKQEGKQDDQQPTGTPPPNVQPERLSQEQAKALLDAMRDNEKPFQMHKFVLPEYKGRQIDKDW
jgi:Ca-activated chloride channel homolog